jgi:hypothetical protein
MNGHINPPMDPPAPKNPNSGEGVAHGREMYSFPTNPIAVARYVRIAANVWDRMNGMIKNGFNMIGRPNMIGSIIQKIAGGKDTIANGLI